MKTLKIWNGRGQHDYARCHLFVAAYSVKQAAEIIGMACGLMKSIGVWEINNYYAKGLWGTSMKDITPTEPCVYAEKFNGKKPFKIYPKT
ncbi:MAG: hypothetical protein PHX80_04645 [Candidatus Nanoarchaeia archaeon]|nr:hypothetical protein [Candidatus Nanoarchaeia archaeon]